MVLTGWWQSVVDRVLVTGQNDIFQLKNPYLLNDVWISWFVPSAIKISETLQDFIDTQRNGFKENIYTVAFCIIDIYLSELVTSL